ncbi:hypothetical protein V6149_11920, partial [Klebsiella pneumoniae]
MIYTIDNLPWIKERLNWQKESTHLALNQIISIYLTGSGGNDSNLLIVFYVQIMPDDLVMQLHR